MTRYWGWGYEVSNLGRVRSYRRPGRARSLATEPHVLQPSKAGRFWTMGFGQNSHCNIHLLVAEEFVGPRPPGMEIRHLDGNPENNRADNLAWGTRSQSIADRKRHADSEDDD